MKEAFVGCDIWRGAKCLKFDEVACVKDFINNNSELQRWRSLEDNEECRGKACVNFCLFERYSSLVEGVSRSFRDVTDHLKIFLIKVCLRFESQDNFSNLELMIFFCQKFFSNSWAQKLIFFSLHRIFGKNWKGNRFKPNKFKEFKRSGGFLEDLYKFPCLSGSNPCWVISFFKFFCCVEPKNLSTPPDSP